MNVGAALIIDRKGLMYWGKLCCVQRHTWQHICGRTVVKVASVSPQHFSIPLSRDADSFLPTPRPLSVSAIKHACYSYLMEHSARILQCKWPNVNRDCKQACISSFAKCIPYSLHHYIKPWSFLMRCVRI